MKKDKFSVVEKHTYTVLSEIEETYPETGLKLMRPKLHIKKILFCVFVTFACDFICSFLFAKMTYFYTNVKLYLSQKQLFFVFFFLILLIVILIFRKSIFIFVIRIYQKYAPYQVRSTCLYIPNCSEYMVLAIKKYGLIKGIKMGVKRYKRCEPPYGGIDYP